MVEEEETRVRELSDYRQQFIPNKVLNTFNPTRYLAYKDFEARPTYGFKSYNEYEKIVGFLYSLRRDYPRLVKIIPIGQTIEKRQLLVVKVSPLEGKTYDRIFVEGGIHANEWLSPNSVIHFINRLVTEWDKLPNYMRTKTWLILPLANPDGYAYAGAKKENRMWRKNRKDTGDPENVGVDLNRNFSIGWDKNLPGNEETGPTFFKGDRPFSEKETQAIRDFLLPQKKYLKAYVAFHCYGQQIRYQWLYNSPIEKKDRLLEVVKEATQKVNSTTGKKRIKYKPYDKPIPGMFGLSRDWARKNLNVLYAFTVELRDKGKKGFKLRPSHVPKTGADVYSFMQIMAKAITDDYEKLKKNIFISHELDELLMHESHLYKKPRAKVVK